MKIGVVREIFYSSSRNILFLIVMAVCGLWGTKLFVSIAPWRVTEICLAALVAFLGGLVVWVLLRQQPIFQKMVIGMLGLVLVGIAYGNFLFFNFHYEREFPPIEGYLYEGDIQCGEECSTQKRQKALRALARGSQAYSNRLLNFLDSITPNSDLLSTANAFLASRFQFYDYPTAQLPSNLSWSEDPYDDRSWNYRLHNMDFVVTLVRAYEKNGNPIYLKKAEELILDWISDNIQYVFKPPSAFSWYDAGTALRLMNWLYFFEVWKETQSEDLQKVETIFRAMLGHASRLADENFYAHHHNHGIDQDRGLLAFSLMYPEVSQASQWKELALDRMSQQVRFAVSPQGVHLEHSPHYHLYGMRQLHRTRDFLINWGVSHSLIVELQKVLPLMATFVPHVVKPDGYLAQIGDTPTKHITSYREHLAGFSKEVPLLKELMESGRTKQTKNVSQVFLDEGYVIIRDFANGQLDFPSSFYLFFSAGAHEGRGHRQADDLSFIVSNGGRELLVDPGRYSYKHDAGRDYVLGVAAHNTVVLDGVSYKGYKTKIHKIETHKKYTLIHASHKNYSGFEHHRWLIFIRPELILVIDRLLPQGNNSQRLPMGTAHRFEQIFHFAPDLEIASGFQEVGVRIQKKGSSHLPVLRLMQLGKNPPSMRIVTGKKDPMQGWHSTEHAKLVPAPALISRLNGQTAEFVTLLEFRNPEKDSMEAGDKDRNYEFTSQENVLLIRWLQEGSMRQLDVDVQIDKVTLN